MAKYERLLSLVVRVGICQNPLPVGRIGAVAVFCENPDADWLYLLGAVREEQETISNNVLPKPTPSVVSSAIEHPSEGRLREEAAMSGMRHKRGTASPGQDLSGIPPAQVRYHAICQEAET